MLHGNHEVQTLAHSFTYTNISPNRSYLHYPRSETGRRHPTYGSDVLLPGRSVLHVGIESGDLVGVV